MRESVYQRSVVDRVLDEFPEAFVYKLGTSSRQGLPDYIVLFGPKWAMLEIKVSSTAPLQPNQQWYVDKFNDMSAAFVIYPENEEEVFYALHETFGA